MTRRLILAFLLQALLMPCLVLADRATSVVHSKHNLSVSGPGEIRSTTETRVCIFCHASHNASTEGPLWNHETTAPGKFQPYTRVTMAGRSEQPNGSTKLCLSCHDGTIAVGAVRGVSRPISMQNVDAAGTIPHGLRSNLGTDLTGTHPVSVKFLPTLAASTGHLRWPPVDPEGTVGVDADGYVQCTSCHDPHGTRSEKYPFWKKETFDQVCQVCHAY